MGVVILRRKTYMNPCKIDLLILRIFSNIHCIYSDLMAITAIWLATRCKACHNNFFGEDHSGRYLNQHFH